MSQSATALRATAADEELYPYRLHAEGVVVYIDSDVIVTSRLDHAFVAARRGMVCAASDPARRWFADWGLIFRLERPLRRQVYVGAAFVAFSTTQFPHLLRRWWKCCDDLAQRLGSPPPDRTNPVALPDQDALNALLMSEVPAGSVELLPQNAVAQGPASSRGRPLSTSAGSSAGRPGSRRCSFTRMADRNRGSRTPGATSVVPRTCAACAGS